MSTLAQEQVIVSRSPPGTALHVLVGAGLACRALTWKMENIYRATSATQYIVLAATTDVYLTLLVIEQSHLSYVSTSALEIHKLLETGCHLFRQ